VRDAGKVNKKFWAEEMRDDTIEIGKLRTFFFIQVILMHNIFIQSALGYIWHPLHWNEASFLAGSLMTILAAAFVKGFAAGACFRAGPSIIPPITALALTVFEVDAILHRIIAWPCRIVNLNSNNG
jgi:hypothetical protein